MMTSSNGNIFRVIGPLCGEFTGSGEFPTQRPVTRSFGVFFDLCLNKRLSKQMGTKSGLNYLLSEGKLVKWTAKETWSQRTASALYIVFIVPRGFVPTLSDKMGLNKMAHRLQMTIETYFLKGHVCLNSHCQCLAKSSYLTIRQHGVLARCWTSCHDDVIKWKHFPRYWPFVRGIHRSPVNSPHKGQWRGALMFSLICAWISSWVNSRDAGDLYSHRAHYDVTIMAWNLTEPKMTQLANPFMPTKPQWFISGDYS